jgi:hypothetical protein
MPATVQVPEQIMPMLLSAAVRSVMYLAEPLRNLDPDDFPQAIADCSEIAEALEHMRSTEAAAGGEPLPTSAFLAIAEVAITDERDFLADSTRQGVATDVLAARAAGGPRAHARRPLAGRGRVMKLVEPPRGPVAPEYTTDDLMREVFDLMRRRLPRLAPDNPDRVRVMALLRALTADLGQDRLEAVGDEVV